MSSNGLATGGGVKIPPRKSLLFLILLLALISPALAIPAENFTQPFHTDDIVHVNHTYILQQERTTPFVVWAGAIILAIWFVILSFIRFPYGEEALISIMAWFPAGYALWSSFSVESIAGFGAAVSDEPTSSIYYGSHEWVLMVNHTVYHFDIVAIGLLIFFIFTFANTLRIRANLKILNQESQIEQKELIE